MPWFQKKNGYLITSFSLLVGFILLHFLYPYKTFWSGDESNKFIQLQSFDRFGLSGIQIPYKGIRIDPEQKYFPDSGNHFVRIKNAYVSYYHIYFPLISVPFYRLFGFAGIYVLPLAFSFLTFLLTACLLRVHGANQYQSRGILLLGLASPFVFYSITFWEHTLAVSLSTAAFVLVLRQESHSRMRFFLAGIAVGVSTIFREEGYVFIIAMVISILFTFPKRYTAALTIAAGWLLIVVPLWIFQTQFYGHAMGPHALFYPSPFLVFISTLKRSSLMELLSNFFVFLFEYHSHAFLKILLVIPHILIVLCGLVYPRKKLLVFLLLSACLTSFILLVELIQNRQPVWNTLYTQGLIPGLVFCLIPFALSRSFLVSTNYTIRFLMIFIFLYMVGTCLNVSQAYTGLIWGPRHFLPAMPAFVALTVAAIQEVRTNSGWVAHKKWFFVATGGLIAVSIGIQIVGLTTIHYKREASAKLHASIQQLHSQTIITDAYWVPEELSTVYFERYIFGVKSDRDFRELLIKLQQAGVKDFIFFRSKQYRKLSEESMKLILQFANKRELLIFPKASVMDSALVRCRIGR